MNTEKIIKRVTAAGLGLFFVSCLGFQLYALNKGFDITDEGYNLQLVQSDFAGISNTYFFETVQLLFGWLPSGLLANRIIATLLLIVSTLLFIRATFIFFEITFSAAHLFFCLLSIPFAVTLDPVTLSYNNVTAAFTLLSAACLFELLHPDTSPKGQFLLTFFCGSCAAVVCSAKITSGFALTLSIPVFLGFISESRWKHIIFFAMGWLVYQLIHGIAYTPFTVQVNNILLAGDVFAKMDAHYEKFALVNDVYLFMKEQFYTTLQFLVVFGIARLVKVYWIKMILWFSAVGYFMSLFYYSQYQLTGFVYVIAVVFCVAFFVPLFVQKGLVKIAGDRYKRIFAAVFLFMLPLIVVVGTNNVYYHNYVFACLPLAVLCVLLLSESGIVWFTQFTLLLIGGCIVYVCYTKILHQPYRIRPLAHQTILVPDGKLKGIKLDAGSLDRYQRLEQRLAGYGFSGGNGLICLGKMQGLQYLLGASSPGGVMFSPTFRELYLLNLANDPNQYEKPYYVISDYRFADSTGSSMQNWEIRFTETLGRQQQQTLTWKLLDSVSFETAPLGVLYLYRTN